MNQIDSTATLSLDDDLTGFVCRYEQTTGMQIGEDLELLRTVINESLKEAQGGISTPEALFFCQALFLPATKPHVDQPLRSMIRATCLEAMEKDGLHKKWGLDFDSMQKRLEAITLCQALAIWHNVKKFWVNPDWDHAKVAELFSTSDA